MSKKILSDVVSPRERSVRNIQIGQKGLKKKSKVVGQEITRNRKKVSSFGIWSIAITLIVFLFFTFSIIFSDTKVLIYPKQDSVNIDRVVEIERENFKAELKYQLITIEKEGSKTVIAVGEEFVEEKAAGMITVFNNFDSKSQKLIKNTRFESTRGLVYRIRNSIVIPGRKEVDGKMVPGNIEVKVYADEPGEKYNTGLDDFTIPGFKGDPRFNKFYAKSITEMKGGIIGTIKTISEGDRGYSVDEIQRKLKEQLTSEIKEQIPEGFVFYDNLSQIVFESLEDVSNGDEVTIRQKAIIYGALFDNKELASYIASKEIIGYGNEQVEIVNPEDLMISPTVEAKEEGFSVVYDDFVDVNIKGSVKIVWLYDENILRVELAGKHKSEIDSVFSKYKNSIDKTEVIIKPFWKRSIPEDLEDIKIERILGDVANL